MIITVQGENYSIATDPVLNKDETAFEARAIGPLGDTYLLSYDVSNISISQEEGEHLNTMKLSAILSKIDISKPSSITNITIRAPQPVKSAAKKEEAKV